ncbi:MAG: MATE family efflux transporter [marine benthic group bacterium]|nr:MATE family efflux transporter [Gemmatimonadota bacterium]MCL7990909.1 MATE family efflux transporter [Gemmatimonadota bacterium]
MSASTDGSSASGTPGALASVREAIHGSEQDFTTGSLNQAVFLLAIPMMLEMAGESLFAVVDAFFVARLGAEALAAVGITETVLEIIYAIAIGLGMSVTAMVARRIGEHDERGAARTAVQAIWVGLGVSVLFGVAGAIWAPDVLRLMGADDATVSLGSTYTRIIYGSMPIILFLFVNNAIYRGAGDAAMAMRSIWLANGINIVLDPLLIFGVGPFPELGLTGAAVATVIGRGIGVLYQFWSLSRGTRLRVTAADVSFDLEIVLRLLRVSAGGILQMLVATASYIGLIRILATFGSTVLAGYVIAIRVVIFIILPSWGLANAAATLVGQNLGAEKPDRAERAVWVTGVWNMAFMAAITVIFVAFAGPIVRVFTSDPGTAEVGEAALRIISYGYVMYAWGMVILQAFNGAGDTWTPTWVNLIAFWLVQIPLAWVLAHVVGIGHEGVYWAIAASYSLSAMIGLVLFRRGKWKLKQV